MLESSLNGHKYCQDRFIPNKIHLNNYRVPTFVAPQGMDIEEKSTYDRLISGDLFNH